MQVYMRKGRLLLSLQAVKHALKLAGAAHPDVHRLIVRLCQAVQQQQQQQAGDDQVKRGMQRFVLHPKPRTKMYGGFFGSGFPLCKALFTVPLTHDTVLHLPCMTLVQLLRPWHGYAWQLGVRCEAIAWLCLAIRV